MRVEESVRRERESREGMREREREREQRKCASREEMRVETECE